MEIHHTGVFAMLYYCLYVISVLWAGGLHHNKLVVLVLVCHEGGDSVNNESVGRVVY